MSESLANAGEEIVRALENIVAFLPNLLGAIVILLLAWLIAKVLRFLSVRLLHLLNRSFERLLVRGVLANIRLSENVIRFAAGVIFFVVFVFGIEAASRALGVDVVTQWIDGIITYLPTMLAGVAILVIGILASHIVRDFVSTSLAFIGRLQSAQIGRFAQLGIVTIAAIVALDQIEIEVHFPVTLIVVLAGAAGAGLSLAFGLGARDFAANLIAAQQASSQFEPGQRVSLNDVAGIIVEITSTMIVVDTESDRVLIPAKTFLEEVSTIRGPEAE